MPYRRPPWIAKVVKDGKQHTLGCFETREEAEAAENVFRRRYGLPMTRKEVAAIAHATMFRMGTHGNRYTVKRTAG